MLCLDWGPLTTPAGAGPPDLGPFQLPVCGKAGRIRASGDEMMLEENNHITWEGHQPGSKRGRLPIRSSDLPGLSMDLWDWIRAAGSWVEFTVHHLNTPCQMP
jgi:hypothetical protein